jgi:hypothetical protein
MVIADSARRSCGTCRGRGLKPARTTRLMRNSDNALILDRRILCDRTTPACLQCSHSKRKCKGYAIRLSWPRVNDGRRSAVVYTPSRVNGAHLISDGRLVHMTTKDVEMHYQLTSSSRNGKSSHLFRVNARIYEGIDVPG